MKAEPGTQKISQAVASRLLPSYRPATPTLRKIAGIIVRNSRFLLTTHVGADADGLGSQVGFYALLKALKKDVKILNNEKIPAHLEPLIPKSLIAHLGEGGVTEDKARKMMKDRFVFILDSSEPKRSDKVGALFLELERPWASMDHHVLPARPEYCVDPSYAATAELVWDLYHYFKIPISAKVALALYTGLVADSGNFRYPKTSLRSHLMGGHLVSLGIHSDYVYRAIYENNPKDRIQLVARLFPRAEILPNGVVYVAVYQKDREGLELGDSGTEGIVNQLLAHQGLKAAAVLIESEEGEFKASLRSIGAVDVASLAKKFGGGGHKNAAGLKILKPFAQVLPIIVEELRQL